MSNAKILKLVDDVRRIEVDVWFETGARAGGNGGGDGDGGGGGGGGKCASSGRGSDRALLLLSRLSPIMKTPHV